MGAAASVVPTPAGAGPEGDLVAVAAAGAELDAVGAAAGESGGLHYGPGPGRFRLVLAGVPAPDKWSSRAAGVLRGP